MRKIIVSRNTLNGACLIATVSALALASSVAVAGEPGKEYYRSLVERL